ncbi:hypothetical protein SNE40_008653 [Patella caerulea]|uniref:Cation efflux protein transmembrane domain-containing protein n=1 Tax=Patella caerulea TaxID=87958 RepID=A0AAN8PNV3_PATCE
MMSGYSSIPDLISSSVTLDLANGDQSLLTSRKTYTSGTIHPFTPARSVLRVLQGEISSVLQVPEAKKICLFLIFNIISSIILLLWCHTTNSMALTAYTYLTLFDIFSILTCLLSIWVQIQKPTPAFSFGQVIN